VKTAPAGVIEIVQEQVPNAVPNGANSTGSCRCRKTRRRRDRPGRSWRRCGGEDVTKGGQRGAESRCWAIINGLKAAIVSAPRVARFPAPGRRPAGDLDAGAAQACRRSATIVAVMGFSAGLSRVD